MVFPKSRLGTVEKLLLMVRVCFYYLKNVDIRFLLISHVSFTIKMFKTLFLSTILDVTTE